LSSRLTEFAKPLSVGFRPGQLSRGSILSIADMLTCKHSKFSLPKNVSYLNCAYLSPMLKAVEKAGLRGVRLKRNPAEIDPDDFFSIVETLRAEFARLIGAQDPDRVAIIPSVSYGLATVARNVRITKGQHVLVAAEQF